MFERVSELVLPEPCFGWILCFKKEEFWFETHKAFIESEKEEKKQTIPEAQTNARMSKREVKREI